MLRMLHPDRILAIKLADLGDLLLTEPAIRSLRTAYPHATIDVLTTPASCNLVPFLDSRLTAIPFAKQEFDRLSPTSLVKGSTSLGNLALRLRRARYDAVLIFHSFTTPAGAAKFRALAAVTGAPVVAGLDNGRGTFLTHRATDLGFGIRHVVEYMLDVAAAVGGAQVDPPPRLNLETFDLPAASTDLPKTFAAIFPVTGPFAPGRNWPVEQFCQLSSLLDQRGIRTVVMGASDATPAATETIRKTPSAIDLTGKTSLAELVSNMNRAEVVVTGDSFPAHLAAALKRPLVAIFGPSNHLAWGPYGAAVYPQVSKTRSTIIRHDVPCSPCLYTGYRLGRRNGCGQRDCLTLISPDEVARAAMSVMERQP